MDLSLFDVTNTRNLENDGLLVKENKRTKVTCETVRLAAG